MTENEQIKFTQKVLHKKYKVQDPIIVVDVGAYTGRNCMFWSEEFPNSRVFGIEACPENYNVFRKKSRKSERVQAFHKAISDKNGQVDFFVSSHHKLKGSSQSNSLYRDFIERKDWAKKLQKFTVESITLDQFCSDNDISKIDLLAINCEGGEYKILAKHAPKKFLGTTEVILLDLHGKSPKFLSEDYRNKKKEICNLLREAGYTLSSGNESFKDKGHIRQVWTR